MIQMEAVAIGTLTATVILALITGYYAWQTREMVKEMVEGRKLASMPILNCDIELNAKPSFEHYNEWDGEYDLKVCNIGNAPALATHICLEPLNPDTAAWRIASQSWVANTIQPSSEKTFEANLATDHEVVQPPTGNKIPKLRVTATYSNVYNVKYQTVSDFESADTNKTYKAHLHPWVQILETSTILEEKAQRRFWNRAKLRSSR